MHSKHYTRRFNGTREDHVDQERIEDAQLKLVWEKAIAAALNRQEWRQTVVRWIGKRRFV